MDSQLQGKTAGELNNSSPSAYDSKNLTGDADAGCDRE